MIRVNLLPQKRRAQAASDGGQLWLLVVMGVVALEIVVCFFLYSTKQTELDERKQTNRRLGTEIETTRKESTDHKRVKERLEQLRAREDAISKLQSARTGPTAVLLEIARLLTPGRGPSVDPEKLSQLRRENPLAVHNPNWDPRRLWLKQVVESERLLKLDGLARDGEDVSELARRMNLSSYFEDVKLLPAKRGMDKDTNLDLVDFKLEAKVKY
jgi:type IV pilus assembly protein PilN